MSDYAIGDVQGCFDALQRLLQQIQFNEHDDRLWFTGDLVNRGSQSLAVLRFLKALPTPPIITLGNHDLHLLSRMFCNQAAAKDDTIDEILQAPDATELGHWLRQQPIVYFDATLNMLMSHAGIPPIWTREQAIIYGKELQMALSGDEYIEFLKQMRGNEPNHWHNALTGIPRLRLICNYFTRMRFCDVQGDLWLNDKGDLNHAPLGAYAWFDVNNRHPIDADIIFGHWAALNGACPHPRIHALDTGCVWGRRLTALCLQNKQLFSVPALLT
jgi:bis(5'-nucleosyl)-tetraphosphatase (symmetrical)